MRWLFVAIALSVGCADDVADCQCEQAGWGCDVEGVCRSPCSSDDDCTLCETCRNGLCLPLSTCRCTEDSDCDDGDACTGLETCDSNGRCALGLEVECPLPTSTCFVYVCVDTGGSAACELQPSGSCPCSTPAECDDDDPCTGAETCSGGQCQPGTPYECPPSTEICRVNVCVNDNGSADCVLQLAPVDSSCDDGVPCTDEGLCNDTGVCIAEPTTCDDGVSCTDDSCDPALDVCEHVVNHSRCDDGASCTTESCDPVNDCVYVPDHSACVDTNPCTDALCDPPNGVAVTGCSFPGNDASCDDGNPCTTNDRCENGWCQAGSPTWFSSCDGGFCYAGVCTVEHHSESTPPSSPCVQDWSPAGIDPVLLTDGETIKFIVGLNATFHANGVECTTDRTYFYSRSMRNATLYDNVQLRDFDYAIVERLEVEADTLAEEVILARSPTLGAALGATRYDQVSFELDPGTINRAIADTTMDRPRAVSRVNENEILIGGSTIGGGEAIVVRCTNPGGGFHWACDPTNLVAVALRPDSEVVALHVAVDPADGVVRGMVAALQKSTGSFQLVEDPTLAGVLDTVDDGVGPFEDSDARGVAAREWDDVVFFGRESVIVECASPPDWICTQVVGPRTGWDIVGGTVSPHGHLFLVGPFALSSGPAGNEFAVLPAGRSAADPAQWVSLPMTEAAGQRPSAVAVSATEVQVLGTQSRSGSGDRVLLWSFEAP